MKIVGYILIAFAVADFGLSYAGINLTPFLPPEIGRFSPIAIGLLVILLYQVIRKKPLSGLLISAVFIFLNLFMVLALISELSEFEVVNQNYNNLIIFGSLYLGLNLLVGGIMFLKYLKLKIN